MKRSGATGDLRLKRILVIHKKLRTKGLYSAWTLVEACLEVDPDATVRKIGSDIGFMRSELLAPIPRTTKHKGYYYEEAFSLFEGLGETYLETLNEVLALIRQMARSKNEFSGLEDLLLRLEQRAAQMNAEPNEAIQFDMPEYSGQKHLIALYRAISDRQFLTIDYQPFPAEDIDKRQVFPLVLKEYNRRWFLIAQEDQKSIMQTLALDRIIRFRQTAVTFPVRQTLPKTYFDNIVGVSHEKDATGVEDIVLRVKHTRIKYVRTKKIHTSQQEEELPDGSWRVTLRLEPNRELTTLLLSYGADLEVLEPLSLRQRIAHQHRMAWEQYARVETEICPEL